MTAPRSSSSGRSDFARGHYRLQSDLDALQRVHAARAPEAVAFYAGRVLEILAAQSLEDLGLAPHQTVLANLDILEQYSLLPLTTRHSAHGLRRLANDARHILRPIGEPDATLAAFFADHCVDWYFHHYSFGPRQPAGAAGAVADPLSRLHAIVSACATAPVTEALALLGGPLRSPVMAAILAESLLDGGRLDAAGAMLARGLTAYPDDTRLLLLHGLHLSRSGKLTGALAVLEPAFRRFPNDPEAAGILAGVYKRLWQQDRTQVQWLKRSFDTYQAGWKASRETSDYLGTNAATTALWLGRRDVSAALARTLRDTMAERMRRLETRLNDPLGAMEYWAGVTVAELELLAGDLPAAQTIYARIFTLHADKTGNIAVTRGQAEMILRAMGMESACKALWRTEEQT